MKHTAGILFLSCFVHLTYTQNMNNMSPEEMQTVMRANSECLSESGLTMADTLGMANGKFKNDAKSKTHLFCMAKKLGFQNEAGELQVDVIRKNMENHISDKDLVEKIMEKCMVEQGTPEDTAFESSVCAYKIVKK